jgi:hypothetical protein
MMKNKNNLKRLYLSLFRFAPSPFYLSLFDANAQCRERERERNRVYQTTRLKCFETISPFF